MNDSNCIKVQGFVLLDVDVVALNNAGKDTTNNFDNSVKTKSIYKNGLNYVYVSGQAWRYWWRDTLQKDYGWNLSPIQRGEKNNVIFTAANPIQYPDDDMFGYMKAAKEDSQEKGNAKLQNITVTRVSPLKNSALVSVASVRPVSNLSCMSRQDGDAALYNRQEYSAIMKGMFSIDVDMVGTFSNYNKSGFMNLSDTLKLYALSNGAVEINDIFGEEKLIRIQKETRIERVSETIAALKTISGGAMQTNNMADVTPKFIVLATTDSGNHPFSHIAISSGEFEEKAVLNIDGIKEIIEEYKDHFKGKIFIGRRSGFMNECDNELQMLSKENKSIIEYTSVNSAIDKYIEQLKDQMI